VLIYGYTVIKSSIQLILLSSILFFGLCLILWILFKYLFRYKYLKILQVAFLTLNWVPWRYIPVCFEVYMSSFCFQRGLFWIYWFLLFITCICIYLYVCSSICFCAVCYTHVCLDVHAFSYFLINSITVCVYVDIKIQNKNIQ